MKHKYLEDNKLGKQIRGAILRFEKTFHCKTDEGKEKETRFFKIKYLYYIQPWACSGQMFYNVTVKETGMKLKVIHYTGNAHFDRSTGWTMIIKENMEE